MEEIQHLGILSVIPPLFAIILAIWTRQVYVSLLLGIFVGWLFIEQFNPFVALLSTINSFVDVFSDSGNTRTVIFTLLVGSLIILIQVSGGVNGFINWISRLIDRYKDDSSFGKKKLVQLLAATTGVLIFVESNISILTVGTLYRPVFEKLGISREKLAYIADSSSAPSCIIIPFNAWGAYVMSLIVLNGLDQPFQILFGSLPYNFYPFLAIILLVCIIVFGKDFGPMKKAEERVRTTGKLLNEGSKPMVSTEITTVETSPSAKDRMFNMVIPIITMVICMPMFLVYTGWKTDFEATSFWAKLIEAIGNGSGSASVLYSVTLAITIALGMYLVQKIISFKEAIDYTLKGMSGMVSLALLIVFAFALGSLCKQMGTGYYVSEITKEWLSPGLVPFIVFLTSCFIAFSTGTSWGTFSIMIAIVVQMADALNANIYMSIAAVLGGGVFGDHCSPISDTTIISSMASASDHVDHVKTQLPYALFAGGITALIYLIMGIL